MPTKPSTPKLHELLSELISHTAPSFITLERKLRIAYTPPGTSGIYRLCLSREKGQPSQLEGETVWAHLCKAKAMKRPFVRKSFGFDERGCFIIEWAIGEQKPLLDVGRMAGGYER